MYNSGSKEAKKNVSLHFLRRFLISLQTQINMSTNFLLSLYCHVKSWVFVQNALNEVLFAKKEKDFFSLSIFLPLINDYLLAAKDGSENKREKYQEDIRMSMLCFSFSRSMNGTNELKWDVFHSSSSAFGWGWIFCRKWFHRWTASINSNQTLFKNYQNLKSHSKIIFKLLKSYYKIFSTHRYLFNSIQL